MVSGLWTEYGFMLSDSSVSYSRNKPVTVMHSHIFRFLLGLVTHASDVSRRG